MNIYEPVQYAVSSRQEAEEEKAEYMDEANTEEALQIMQDWRTLHQYDNRYDFSDLPGQIITDWVNMGKPTLIGHPEITETVIQTALETIENGDIYSAESYMLCSAICEAMDSMVTNHIVETPAYEVLFEKVKEIVESEGGDDEY